MSREGPRVIRFNSLPYVTKYIANKMKTRKHLINIGLFVVRVYIMKQGKRELCIYDVKRYLPADLQHGRLNLNNHAYGQRDVATMEHLVAD